MRAIQLSSGKETIVDDDDFKWLNKWKWSYLLNGYAYRMEHSSRAGGIKRHSKIFLMHREILKVSNNYDVDHINGNGLDNRKDNLRVCTTSQNLAWKKIQSNNTSGYRGVYWHEKNKNWRVILSVNNKRHNIGSYKNKLDAATAYDIAKIKYFGEFGRTNL